MKRTSKIKALCNIQVLLFFLESGFVLHHWQVRRELLAIKSPVYFINDKLSKDVLLGTNSARQVCHHFSISFRSNLDKSTGSVTHHPVAQTKKMRDNKSSPVDSDIIFTVDCNSCMHWMNRLQCMLHPALMLSSSAMATSGFIHSAHCNVITTEIND